jgi:hypothetical protein
VDYPRSLQPASVERLQITPGREVDVPKTTPRFRPWRGDRPEDTFGGKSLLDYAGRLAFAELAILWTFQEEEGWDGVWLDSYRQKFRIGYWDQAPLAELPPPQGQLLARISERTKAGWRGRWDVLCWRTNGDVLFAESKRVGRDAIRDSQRAWLAAALDIGLTPANFLVVEWALVG